VNSYQTNLSAVAGPISTSVVATSTDPVPRYIESALLPDCQQTGDCSAGYFPVLTISTNPVAISGASLGPVETVSVPISDGGGSQLNLSISVDYDSGSGWLTAVPVAKSGQLVLSLAADPASLQPGPDKATVNLDAGGGGSAAIPVVFSVTQKGITIQAIVNAASYQSGSLAPGAYVAIFGHDLLGTTGSQAAPIVTFDNVPASVIYSSPTQINLIVPPGLAAQNSATVHVAVGNETSNAFQVTLTPNMPGIFSPGFVNSDGSVNSALNAAVRGDYLQVYMTGLAFPTVPGAITVNIGDQRGIAPLFAGPQPTYPALDQINVTIPASLSGGSVPLAVCVTTLPGTQPLCSNSETLYIR
jgi:uncharacterized protein (TIGR03437 family)